MITKQPDDVNDAEIGQKYQISVIAEGESLSYRWKISTDGGQTFVNTGAKGYATPNLTITVSDKYDGYQYYCMITDANGNTLSSDIATVHLQLTDGVFTYQLNETANGMIVTHYLPDDATSAIVPETFNEFPVVKIGDSAFENKTSLVSVDLPDTIIVIGRRAFAGCTNLSQMS